MDYQFYDFVGNVGVALILGSYFLVQIRKMSVTDLPYTVLNFLGAALVLYSLVYDFNLSAVIIEIAWLAISVVGLLRILRERQSG